MLFSQGSKNTQTDGQNDKANRAKSKSLVGMAEGFTGFVTDQNEKPRGLQELLLLFLKVFCKFEVISK